MYEWETLKINKTYKHKFTRLGIHVYMYTLTYFMIMIIKDSIVIDRCHWAYVTSDGETK